MNDIYHQFMMIIYKIIDYVIPIKPRQSNFMFPAHINSLMKYRQQLWKNAKFDNVYQKFLEVES